MNSSSLVLRAYQEEAVEKAFVAKKGTIKAATGTGKTLVAIAWLEKIGKNSLIIVPTQALIYQSWTPKLQDYGFENVGEYYAYAKKFGPVTVTTFSSATSHPELVDSAEAIVVDEIHHLGASQALSRLLPKLKEKEYVLGLSSVPEREDKTHEVFLKEFPIIFDLSLGSALRSGYVSPIETISIAARMTEKERAQYEMLTSNIQRAFRFCGPNMGKWMRCYDPKARKYVGREGIWAIARRKTLLSGIESKKQAVLEIVNKHSDKPIILFAESVKAIENIRDYLVSNGVTCETFHAGTEQLDRVRILENWGEQFQVLLSCRALEEGLDVKEVAIGILITNGKSKRQFIQRIGRVIRPVEGKQAKFYIVYCPDTVEETYSSTISRIIETP
ncbi:MAG: DEAD/DEAH box helicase [archaeon]|nr:DEAD/DEAH box helicase [archaeon]